VGRRRVYTTVAERQQAYRLRLAQRMAQGSSPTPKVTRKKPLSRPARLTAAMAEVSALRSEYENWLEALPDTLQESEQADRLREMIEQLQEILDLMVSLDPPRGFGRD
jgi:hypothetical protein